MKKKIDDILKDNSTEFNYYLGSNETSTNYTNYNKASLNSQISQNKNITLNPYRNNNEKSLYKNENLSYQKNSKSTLLHIFIFI